MGRTIDGYSQNEMTPERLIDVLVSRGICYRNQYGRLSVDHEHFANIINRTFRTAQLYCDGDVHISRKAFSLLADTVEDMPRLSAEEVERVSIEKGAERAMARFMRLAKAA